MTTDTPKYIRRDDSADAPAGAHYIETGVKVYLMRDPEGLDRWVIDSSTVDGYPLDSTHDSLPTNEECCCQDEDACHRTLSRMAAALLPGGEQLMFMLADTLGYTLTRTTPR